MASSTRLASSLQAANSSWCTIESDPGVFTELIQEIGVKGVQVEEIYDMDLKSLAHLKPIYGLIFLFKWRSEPDNRPIATNCELFFASQVITNACATQAILSILLNAADVTLGAELSRFKEFTSGFPPELKGLAITNSEVIRHAHNSFARAEGFSLEDTKSSADDNADSDDLYHFISYVPVNGRIYELDGLKAGPIELAEVPDGADWLDLVLPIIKKRIDRYAKSEITFNLLALIGDRLELLERQQAAAEARRDQLRTQLQAPSPDAAAVTADDDVESSSKRRRTDDSGGGVEESLAELEIELAALGDKRHKELETRASRRVENVRRKHDYTAFLMQLLIRLGERNKLEPLVQQATAKKNSK
eukprot:TRINITY_DN2900_c0_g1_i1.p1 TRINITY_DN2900_c0_g1~~TRINITY_DN2900_c0_g1_i1.p1  ORF type:complete len:362 (-),score=119.55 TRINITY_DN2900_c0_g1_i1:268-1353(-)